MSESSRRSDVRGRIFVSLLFLTFVPPAHAYVDPGSVSVLITAVLGAIAAVGYTARTYWERFKSSVARAIGKPDGEEEAQPEDASE